MVNKQRVQLFRHLIYAFIVLVLLLPVVLVVMVFMLSFRVFSLEEQLSARLETLTPPINQTVPGPTSADGGYVIEPGRQDVKGEGSLSPESPVSQPESTAEDFTAGDAASGDATQGTIEPPSTPLSGEPPKAGASETQPQPSGGMTDTGEDSGQPLADSGTATDSEAIPQNDLPIGEGTPDSGVALSIAESSIPKSSLPQTGLSTFAGTLNEYCPVDFKNLYFDSLAIPSPPTGKTLYLTFDIAPSPATKDILDLLDKYDVKCTFFVVCDLDKPAEGILNEIVQGGHSIGVYPATESPDILYSSKECFLKRFSDSFDSIAAATGVRTRFYQLPGDMNANAARQGILLDIKEELGARGFLQFEMNTSARDAVSPTLSKAQILENIANSIPPDGRAVIQLHDNATASLLEALDEMIPAYTAQGYAFEAISANTAPFIR